MIKIEIGQRLIKSSRRQPELVGELESALALIARDFGKPHQHAGLGLRKIAPRSYEARIGLHLRIVLVHLPDRLLAYDLMTHEQVRVWLKR
jgi:hypothetical protein